MMLAQNMLNWLLYKTKKLKPSPTLFFLIGSVVLKFKSNSSRIKRNNSAIEKN